MKKYIILICVIIGLVVSGFIGYFVYKGMNSIDTDIATLKSKADQEMEYLDNTIISMMNRFNNITYSNYKIVESEVKTKNQQGSGASSGSSSGEQSGGTNSGSQGEGGSGSQGENKEDSNKTMIVSNVKSSGVLINDKTEINWDIIKEEVESIYTNWPSILVDLNSLNVNQDNLMRFSDTLNQLISSIDDKNKKEALINLADLYSLKNLYISEYSENSTLINLGATKAYIARAYALIEEDNRWDEIKNNISSARSQYNNVMNSSLQNGNINSINKAYVLLGEMEKNIDSKNKNVFLINYKNLMKELDVIDN